MSWPVRQRACAASPRIDELELAGRADEVRGPGLLVARRPAPRPRSAAIHRRAVSVRTCGSLTPMPADAALDDVARRSRLARRDRLARPGARTSSVTRSPPCRSRPEHGAELDAGHLIGQPREAERRARQVDEDRHQGDHPDHPRGDATPGHAGRRNPRRAGCRAGASCLGHETRRFTSGGRRQYSGAVLGDIRPGRPLRQHALARQVRLQPLGERRG